VLTTHTGAMALVGWNVVVADSTAEGSSAFRPRGPVTGLTTGLSPRTGRGSRELDLLGLRDRGGAFDARYGGHRGTPLRRVPPRVRRHGVLRNHAGRHERGHAGESPPATGAFGSGLAIDDTCLYVADNATGVYSVGETEWSLAPMRSENVHASPPVVGGVPGAIQGVAESRA